MSAFFSNKPVKPLLIFACGNPDRGDDALGPALIERLRARSLPAHVELLEDFQLQVEHALDLVARKLVLFVDADVSVAPPLALTRLEPATEFTYTTHVMPPQAVLHTYRQLYHTAPPPAFLLSISGVQFELGTPLGPAARRHLQSAFELTWRVIEQYPQLPAL